MRNAFTLIELIIVIVLLGILSAVAVPKYFDLTTDAHLSKVKGAQSALATGIGLMQSKYLISKEKQGINKWTNDFPEPANASECSALWQAAMSSSAAVPTELTAGHTYDADTDPDFMYTFDSGCKFYYTGTLSDEEDEMINNAQFALFYVSNGIVNLAKQAAASGGFTY